ncbi:MAG TPA: ECF-type sigma factor [Prosthecobacter sp.]
MSFPETRWSMLAAATAHGDEAAMQALDDWCRRYWQPVFAVIRSRETSPETARERTQAFFVHLLEKSTLRRADPTRGRFRTFLLTVLWRFLRDERKHRLAEKRGGDAEMHSLDDVENELVEESNPLAETLDREWALTMLERALERVRHDIVATRSEAAWQVLRHFLPGSSGSPVMAEAAAVLAVTEAGARTEIHRLRNRCREALRRELMSTVSSPEDLEDEIAHLGRVLRGASAQMA